MSGKQRTISHFFQKKKPEAAPEVARTPPSPTPAARVAPAAPATVAARDMSDIERKRRHEAFVKTFGQLEDERAEKRQRLDQHDDSLVTDTVQQEQPEQEAPSPFARFANTSSTKAAAFKPQLAKYTPLEQQVVDLKKQHPGVLLAIEVGYKYRFFGDDAKVASKVLHIAHFVDRNFYVASIPVHRLMVHVRRLVHAGHRVGIVEQTETAAIKATGSNKSAPFERKMTHLYTKGTFVEEMMTDDAGDTQQQATTGGGYLLCVLEEPRGGSGRNELVEFGIVAVQLSSGDVIYDKFDDGFLRTELETRLLHIEPCELLLPASMSKATEKVIMQLTDHLSRVGHDTIRIERLEAKDDISNKYSVALDRVTEFYKEINQADQIARVLELPELIVKSLATTIRHLREFGLERVFHLTQYSHFSSRGHMLINGNTATNLEIFRNATTFTRQGSLVSVLDHTLSRFGSRLFKKWIGRPLVAVDKLNERCAAVTELATTPSPKVKKCQDLLKSLPDLERGICRINYGLSSPRELISVLDGFIKVSSSFIGEQDQHDQFQSPLLNSLFEKLPRTYDAALHAKSLINPRIIDDTTKSKVDFFQSDDFWPELAREKESIAEAEAELEAYLKEVEKELGLPLEFKTVANIEYLIEIKNTQVRKVPQNWIKISGTKAMSRFHSPFIIDKLKKREVLREQLTLDAERAYREFLRSISDQYELFRDVIQSLSQLDCLLSLAKVAQQPGYVKPTFAPDTKIHIVNGRHPMVERHLDNYVPNDTNFDADGQRTMILTGPNMGGKSSLIRQVALITMMAQIGSYVPADSAEIGIVDAIYTRMGASDNMLMGESTFMVELQETSMIMKQATPRSLVILDELGRGTSTHDGMAIAYSVLQYFITHIRCITLFVTHYPALGKLADQYPDSTSNGHMSFIEDATSDIPRVVFLYKLVQGIATKSYGLNVAHLAGLPLSVTHKAKQKSEEMEELHTKKQAITDILKSIVNEDADKFRQAYPLAHAALNQ
ncbi:muts domain V-domain-containing protein [Gongronella butleri]|nr:muts domain V-domain-containing protein [Gongronella butleri]